MKRAEMGATNVRPQPREAKRSFHAPNVLPGQSSLAYKRVAPQKQAPSIARDVLLLKIFKPLPKPVTALIGPAGHGKTSLLVQAEAECRARGIRTAWLSLEASDNDLAQLLHQIQQILADLEGGAGAQFVPEAPAGSAVSTSRADWIVSRLFALDEPVALFFDDLHVISNPAVLQLFRSLVLTLKEPIHFFFASRINLDVGFAQQVVSGRGLIIYMDDLLFTREESRALLQNGGDLQLSTDEEDTIFGFTRGWPAATQLYRLALMTAERRSLLSVGKSCQARELADYLSDTVLSQQSPDVQDFLVRTSLLVRMSGDLCDHVLGRTDSHVMIAELERSGLFLHRLESDDYWFGYHPIFSDFLKEHVRLRRDISAKTIHLRAGEWFRDAGSYEPSLHHFCEAGEYRKAVETFDVWLEDLVPRGESLTVARWAHRIPAQELQRASDTCIKISWAILFLSAQQHKWHGLLGPIEFEKKLTDSRKIFECAMMIRRDRFAEGIAVMDDVNVDRPTDTRLGNFEKSVALIMRGYHAMTSGALAAADDYITKAFEFEKLVDSKLLTSYMHALRAVKLVGAGQLGNAYQVLQMILASIRMDVGASVAEHATLCSLMLILYESGDIDGVIAEFERNREIILRSAVHDWLIVSFRSAARAYGARKQPERMLEVLREAESSALSAGCQRAIANMKWERVRHELLNDRIDQARIFQSEILDTPDPDPDWIRFSEETEGPVIGKIRFLIYTGRAAEGMAEIEKPLASAKRLGRIARQMKLMILSAIAGLRQGDEHHALQSFGEALELAAPGGYLSTFLDEGSAANELMLRYSREIAAQGRELQPQVSLFLRRLLAHFNPDDDAHETSTALPAEKTARPPLKLCESFTQRERKVFSMLCEYKSNDQIAQAMFVTRDTVKYHLKNIYEKLGVHSRLEAIRVARHWDVRTGL